MVRLQGGKWYSDWRSFCNEEQNYLRRGTLFFDADEEMLSRVDLQSWLLFRRTHDSPDVVVGSRAQVLCAVSCKHYNLSANQRDGNWTPELFCLSGRMRDGLCCWCLKSRCYVGVWLQGLLGVVALYATLTLMCHGDRDSKLQQTKRGTFD